MVFLVPFDGSSRAYPALDRAINHGSALDRDVVAVSYVPTGADFAERRRWVDPSENFPADSVASDLERKIAEATDDAELEYEDESAHSPPGGLSREVRQTALDVDATVLFVGAADDSQVVVPIDADADEFDVHVVRRS
jgi:nucleotide-binding universal stress UspA family protein